MRVLIADNDVTSGCYLRRSLTEAAYVVDMAHDGDEVLWLAENYKYDVMIIDVMMPGRDGISAVRHLRRHNILTPVMFLSARSAVEDRVHGLDAGGDDYLTKPFSMIELLARLRALTRRPLTQLSVTLRVYDLELSRTSRTAHRANVVIDLTNREFALLEILMTASPNPVGKTTLIESIWNQPFDSRTNLVNVYINRLRHKIDLPEYVPLLHTVRGVGFVIRPPVS